jgi:hypothetical protein
VRDDRRGEDRSCMEMGPFGTGVLLSGERRLIRPDLLQPLRLPQIAIIWKMSPSPVPLDQTRFHLRRGRPRLRTESDLKDYYFYLKSQESSGINIPRGNQFPSQ